MPDEKCILKPERDCTGSKRAEEVAGDLKALDRRFTEFQQAVSETNSRFGSRIGKLEAKNEVREEQLKQIKERIGELSGDVVEFRKESKDSLGEFRREHKDSVEELRRDNRSILEALTPLKHKVEGLEHLSGEVDEIKEKPAKRWDNMVWEIIKWGVLLLLAIAAAKIGLSA